MKSASFSRVSLVALAAVCGASGSVLAQTFLVGNQQNVGLNSVTINGNALSITPSGSPTSRWIYGMSLDSSNNLWFTGGTDTAAVLGRIDPVTGQTISQVALSNVGYGLMGISFAPNGTLYAVRDNPFGTNTLGTLDPNTGVFTDIGDANYADDIAFVGNTLYSIDRNWGLCTINTATGGVTDVNPGVGGNGQRGMTYYNGVMYLSKTGIERINLATGVTTVIGTNAELGNLQGGLAYAIPTPGAAALVGTGGLLAMRRRRK